MPNCSFSGKPIPPGQGIMYVKKDGKVLWFLNSKAEKNYLKLKRKPRNVKWTVEARAQKASSKATAQRAKPAAKQAAKTKPSATSAKPKPAGKKSAGEGVKQ